MRLPATSMKIRAANITDKPAWLAVRRRQRPALSDQQHERDWVQMMEQRSQRTTLMCVDEQGASLGMIEVSRRVQSDLLGSGPVVHVDALHVEPGESRVETAQRLADAAAGWAQALGCRVLVSDTSHDNQWEQKLHLELGFEEVARKVVYRRVLAAPATVPEVVPATPATLATLAPAASPMSDAHAGHMQAAAEDHRPSWWPGPLRAVIVVLGILSLYFTNVFSGDVFVGVILPIVDVFFVIYLLMLFVSMKYRRKTGAGERHLDMYQVSNDRE
jgi:aminoglycoside 6'-N-acetyltransferase I